MKTALSFMLIVVLSSLVNTLSAFGINSMDHHSRLAILDDVVANRDKYYQIRQAKADSIQSLLELTEDSRERLRLYQECGDVLTHISTDAAISVFKKGLDLSRELGDSCYVQRFVIDISHACFKRGQIIDCLRGMEKLREDGLCPGVEAKYHYVLMVVYTTLGGFYSQDDNLIEVDIDSYMPLAYDNAEKVLRYVGKDTPVYYYAKALGNFVKGQVSELLSNLNKIIEITPEGDSYNELAHTVLAEYYLRVGNTDEALDNYISGALTDIRLAKLDEVALLRLGELLYKLGDRPRAYNYLAVSHENAVKGDMKFNLMRFNNAFMDVSKEQMKDRHQRVSILIALVVILIILLLVVAKMIVDKRREVKHLRTVESRLARANLAKETYIAQFMNLCSSYIESLEDYNRMSKRKITAGQTEDLLAYIKSGKIIEEQRHKFYDVFDRALLHIFPNYIQDVNKLLQPDKQISTPGKNVLTTELRILALSRLGIEDASIISNFLGVSTNTIYTYRNKLRTRAIDRSTFEEDARRIGVV